MGVLPKLVHVIDVMEMVQFLNGGFFSRVLTAASGFAPVSFACVAQLAGYALKRSPYTVPPGRDQIQRVKQPSRRNLEALHDSLFPLVDELHDDVGRRSLDGLLAIYPHCRGHVTDLVGLYLKHMNIVRTRQIRRFIGITLQRSVLPHLAAKISRLILWAFGWDRISDELRWRIIKF
jgi:hypothetical protein